ncbi:MAG: RIP metalloprotease RseP [Candidatus Omnitrophota bacterium]
MLSLIAFIFVLSVLVIVHEFGHFIIAKAMKVRVETFSIGFGKKLFSFKWADTEYRVSAIPLGGYVKMAGDNPEEKREGEKWEFLSKSLGKRAAIVAAGPIFNYVFAFLVFSLVFFIGFAVPRATIGDITDGYPAQIAGLQAGDKILSIDGVDVSTWEEMSSIIHQKTENKEVAFNVQRGDKLMFLNIVPKVIEDKNLLGDTVKVGLIGIAPSEDVMFVRFGPGESVLRGAGQVWTVTQVTYKVLFRVITGKMSARASLTGPIGIFKITGEAAKMGFTYLLQMMALLSVSLAIINLFPIPVLDGGHLVFMIVEKIKGKPVSVKSQEIASRIGFSLLIALMMFTFYNDLMQYGFFDKAFKFFGGK